MPVFLVRFSWEQGLVLNIGNRVEDELARNGILVSLGEGVPEAKKGSAWPMLNFGGCSDITLTVA